MSMTGLEAFDSTVHQTNVWLKSLMGKIGAGNFFFVGTDFDQVMAEAGALLLYYWDSNAGDNTEFVSVDISLNPDLPAPGALGLIGLGLGFLLYRRRKS